MTRTANRHPGLNLETEHYVDQPRAELTIFGFWVFMMSDLIIFACFFATFLTMDNPMAKAGGPGGAQLFDLTSVAIQTGFLLCSSFAFGLASVSMKYADGRGWTILWMAVSLALGLGFLTFELRDFASIWAQGGTPQRSGYWSAFYALVGLHGLHVAAGAIWMAVMITQLAVFGPHAVVKSRVLRLGLYWHFLDVVWIGIFSLVFLRALA